MKNVTVGLCVIAVLLFGFTALAFEDSSNGGGYPPEMQAKIDEVKKELKKCTDDKSTVDKNLKTFDELDFVVFSNQEWTRLHESHSKDVKVNWPDGHYTNGIEKHIEDLKALFVYAPDTSIKVHPVKIGSGEWTSVIGVMTEDLYHAHAGRRREIHSANGQEIFHKHVHCRALERRRYDRRMVVLGQCDIHEADGNRKLGLCPVKCCPWTDMQEAQ